jgi:ComF family protein
MFDAALAAWRYEEPIASLITRFKYGGDLAAGRVLALGLAERAEPVERPQALVPVPLHWRRLRERGFDQALEIARVLSRSLERPVLELIERRRATAAQAALSAAERRRNLRAAFAPIRGAVVPVHVALIDDVMTTGSTLDAAARVLRAAGAQRIDAWVLARAE